MLANKTTESNNSTTVRKMTTAQNMRKMDNMLGRKNKTNTPQTITVIMERVNGRVFPQMRVVDVG